MLTLPAAHWVGVVAMFSCGGGEVGIKGAPESLILW